MYANLKKELMQKGISVTAAAALIGMPEPTFRTKLNGRAQCGFSIEEAFCIKENIFPERDLVYLFTKAKTDIA